MSPSVASLVTGNRSPSSSMDRASPEMPPGARAPMSAWWATLATKPDSRPPKKKGDTTVTSGRWVPPPTYGSFATKASPGRSSRAGYLRRVISTTPSMEPRCSGMCSA